MVTKSVLCGNCSRALVILVLIITIDSSYKAPFSNRVELTVLYKQLITHTHTHTHYRYVTYLFVVTESTRFTKSSLSPSLSHTHTQSAFYTSNNLFTFSRHPHFFKNPEILYHNLTELCNIALRLKLYQLMQRTTLFSTTDPLFFTLPLTVILTSDLRSTASARLCTIYNSRNDTH